MASGWIKTLRCKSVVAEDVYRHHHYKPPMSKKHAKSGSFSFSSSSSLSSSNKKNHSKLYSDLGCGKTSKHLEDIVRLAEAKPKIPKSHSLPSRPSFSQLSNEKQRMPSNQTGGIVLSAKPLQNEKLSILPTLIPLRPNQSSRKVVEIIFTSNWWPTTAFCGEIEMVFKVQNSSKKVAAFEEYRQKMRSCAGPNDSRCAADGNEMMRFHSAPAFNAKEPLFGDGCIFPVPGNGSIRTFSGSGGAHSTGVAVGGKRRAMVICRVLAGRVWTGLNSGSDRLNCESVSIRTEELIVFDSMAVLPCFLIIYSSTQSCDL